MSLQSSTSKVIVCPRCPTSYRSFMQHPESPSSGQEGCKFGIHHASLPVRCRLSFYVEDISWACVCHYYPLLTWKRAAMYQHFSRKCTKLFVIICGKQHTVSSSHCIPQIWQIIHFHSAHKAKCYLTVKK